MHQKQDAAIQPNTKYEMAAMQRFIRYARAIRPVMSSEARTLLVESYKRLRGEDAAPGSATAYRITVRQLEALVRLSEARARVDASPVVRVSHVREATRLLKVSPFTPRWASPPVSVCSGGCAAEQGGVLWWFRSKNGIQHQMSAWQTREY